MIKSKRFLLWALGLISIGVLAGIIFSSNFNWTHRGLAKLERGQRHVVLGSQQGVPQDLLRLQNTSRAFVQIAKEVIPTVVSIHSTKLISAKEGGPSDSDEKGFWDFFGDRFFRFRIPREFKQEGSGSGIIVSADGYVLTNTHVVEGAEQIKVTLDDNRSFDANIVGADPLTEVAVVKIDGKGFPVARLGNSDEVQVGEWVLAIGNPLELRSTVTAGIVSALSREVDIIRDRFGVEDFIQTDAVINPGNSGGALVNLRGEVIGVNTAIATRTGFYQGYGFAIPINLAREVMNDLITEGRVVRGYLGISMSPMNEKKARALKLERPMGVFIEDVLPDGPAKEAGVNPADVLLKIDDKEVSKPNEVQNLIARKNPGDRVRLSLVRKGKKTVVTVILGERKSHVLAAERKAKKNYYDDLGLEVRNLDSRLRRELGLKDEKGVIVVGVKRYGPAGEAGIHVGDLITKIGDQKIRSVRHFKKALKELHRGEVVMVTILREENTLHAFVEVPNK